MIVTAVMQHLGQLLQGPLLSALRPLLQNYPNELLRVAHSGGALGNAAGLLAHVQHQVQQVSCNPAIPPAHRLKCTIGTNGCLYLGFRVGSCKATSMPHPLHCCKC